MDEANIQPTESTPVEAPQAPAEVAPVEEAKQPNVYGDPSGRAYSDSSRALIGNLKNEAKALDAEPEAVEAPPGERFGMTEARKHQIAAELKAQKGQLATATAAAPAKAKPARPAVDPVALVGDYFTREDVDHSDLLGRLYDTDYDRYQGLVDHVISSNRDYAMRLLGENIGPRATDPQYAHLPEQLRQVAADMRPDIWAQLSYASPAEQQYHLRREYELQEAQRAEWERAEAQHQQILQDVERAGVEIVKRASAYYHDQHLKSFKDFKPHEEEYRNENVCNVLMYAVDRDMAADGHFAKMQQDALLLALEIPYLNAQGKTDEAEIAGAQLREMAEVWNAEYARHLNYYRNEYAAMARDAQSWREYQKTLEKEEQKKADPLVEFDTTRTYDGTRYHPRKR